MHARTVALLLFTLGTLGARSRAVDAMHAPPVPPALCSVTPMGRWGDANGDDIVNIVDAQQLARFSIGLTVSVPAAAANLGDVTNDGLVNVIDAQQVARFSVGLTAAPRVAAPASFGPLLAIPSTTSASLGPGDCTFPDGTSADVFILDVVSSQTLSIAVTSTAFDAVVKVYGANGVLVTSDNNGGGGTNARITTPLATGTYMVAATSASIATGAYQIIVGNPTCTPANTLGPLAVPTVIAGALSASDCTFTDGTPADVYTLSLDMAIDVQIDLTSTAFDPFLFLYDIDGNVLVADNNSGGGTSARMHYIIGAGTYYVVANANGPGAGSYELRTTMGRSCLFPRSLVGDITLPQTINGTLSWASDCIMSNGALADPYRLLVTERREVSLGITAAYGGQLRLLDQEFNLMENSPSITRFLNPGTFYLLANTPSVVAGPYQLDAVATPRCVFPKHGTAVVIPYSVTGALEASDCTGLSAPPYADLYRITVTSAQGVQVAVTSGAFQPTVQLYNTIGTQLGDITRQGGPGTLSARTILQPGTYDVVVSSGAVALGSYNLDITSYVPCNVLNPGTVTIAIGQTLNASLAESDCEMDSGAKADMYRLTVPTTQTVQVKMVSTAFDAYLRQHSSTSFVVAENDNGAGSGNAWFTLTLAPGTYYFGASGKLTAARGAYDISVTPVTLCSSPLAITTQIGVPQTVVGEITAADCALPEGNRADLYQATLADYLTVRLALTNATFDARINMNGPVVQQFQWAPGTQSFHVTSPSLAPGLGTYQLDVSVVNACWIPHSPATPVTLPATVNATLTSAACVLPNNGRPADIYKFVLTAEQTTVQYNMTSTAFGPHLWVFDSGGTIWKVASSQGVTLPTANILPAGTYYVAASTLNTTGSYVLTITTPGQ